MTDILRGAAPESALDGARVLITGGAGLVGSTIADQLARRRRRRDRRPRQLRPRAPREPGVGRWPAAGSTVVEGDIRDRAAVAKAMSGVDVVFHQAAIRITQCAEEPRLGARGPRRRHVQRHRGGRRRRRRQGRRGLVGVGLRPGRRVPHDRAAPPVRQPHALRRGEGVQRGPAPQLPRDVRPRLRRPALLQRVRPPHGHLRRLHRGARPLDGADRGRRAAADPRRRHPDHGLRLRRRHRRGQRRRRVRRP